MKKIISTAFFSGVVFWGQTLVAAQPPDIGNFRGLVFSSPTLRHPLEIYGGKLTKCEATAASPDLSVCDVEGGTVIVNGSEHNSLNINLSRAIVLRRQGEEGEGSARHYYLNGTVALQIGEKAITAPVRVTLNFQDSAPTRVKGFIELPDQNTRANLEAYSN